MAEIIGLTASIGAITSAGLKTARAISTIASDLGGAGAEISGIATDLRAVSLTLNKIKKHLSKADNIPVEVVDAAYEIVALCKTDIEGVEKILIPLTSPLGQNLKLKNKVKWLFEKAKVSSRRASLDSLKLTLSLFLLTVDFIENGDEGSDDVADCIKGEVSNLVVKTQSTKTALLNAERLDTAFEFKEGTSMPYVLHLESGDSKSGESDVKDTTVSRPSICDKGKTQLIRFPSQANSTAFLVAMPDEQLIQISEHLRVQNTVRELALKTVHAASKQESQAATSFDDATQSQTHNWQGDQEAHVIDTVLPSRGRLEKELADTKVELNRSLERIAVLAHSLSVSSKLHSLSGCHA
jgi:hypothetical protein